MTDKIFSKEELENMNTDTYFFKNGSSIIVPKIDKEDQESEIIIDVDYIELD